MCKIRVGKALGGPVRGESATQGQTRVCCWLGTRINVVFLQQGKGRKDSGKTGKIKYFVKLENVLTGFIETKI